MSENNNTALNLDEAGVRRDWQTAVDLENYKRRLTTLERRSTSELLLWGGDYRGECPTRVKPLPVSIWGKEYFQKIFTQMLYIGEAFSRQSQVISSEMKYLAILH